MSTQHLMKGFTVKAERLCTWKEPELSGCIQAWTKQDIKLTRAHISPMFDLRLLISSSRLAFVSLFVVLGVYYPAIIVSGGRQTHVELLHPAKVNSPHRKRAAIMFVRQGVFVILCVSSAVCIITEETCQPGYPPNSAFITL